MKSELRHLLDKLKADRPNFKQLVFSHNGRSMAVYGGAPLLFETLADLEAWLYRPAPAAPTEHETCQCPKCQQLRAAAPQSQIINRHHDSRSEQQPKGNQSVAGLGSPSSIINEPEQRTSGFLQTDLPANAS